jgi:hypothetical protein
LQGAGPLAVATAGAAFGFAWHAPGRPSTWADIRSWGTFAAVVLGFTVAALELNLQRHTFETEARRNVARDELLDQQRRELGDAQRLREREQAEGIDLTYDDMQAEQGKSLAVVINDSRRPIYDIAVRFATVRSQPTPLLPAERSGEMYPVDVPARAGWMLAPATAKPGPRQAVIRAGGRTGFDPGRLSASRRHCPGRNDGRRLRANARICRFAFSS